MIISFGFAARKGRGSTCQLKNKLLPQKLFHQNYLLRIHTPKVNFTPGEQLRTALNDCLQGSFKFRIGGSFSFSINYPPSANALLKQHKFYSLELPLHYENNCRPSITKTKINRRTNQKRQIFTVDIFLCRILSLNFRDKARLSDIHAKSNTVLQFGVEMVVALPPAPYRCLDIGPGAVCV